MTERSNRASVRNPIQAIPEVRERFEALPPESRAAIVEMLQAIRRQCRENAAVALKKHKPPMYAYWKAMAVNARHLALAGKKTVRKAEEPLA